MNTYTIIADSKVLDTYNDISISLNYSIDDITTIDKRNTNFSKTIIIPGTPSNNLFFKQIFDVNVDNVNFNPSLKIPASIRIGDNNIMQGNLQLMNIIINKEAVDYEVVIFGELKNIISEFGDYTLKNLNFSEYNHTRNKDNIQDSWSYINKVNTFDTNLVGEGKGYVYPYIINGNSSDIYDTVYIYDLYPAFYLKTYIDKMFEFVGFTYTSDFINSSYFKKLILPFIGDKIEMDAAEQLARKAIVSINGDEGTSNEYKLFMPEQEIGTGWEYNNDFANYYLGLDRETGTVTDDGQEVTYTDESNQWNGSQFVCDEPGRYDISFKGQCVPKLRDITTSDITYQSGTSEYFWRLQLVKTNGSVIDLDSSRDINDPNDLYGIREFDLSDSIAHTSPWYDFDTQLAFSASANDVMMEAGDEIRMYFGLFFRSDMNFAGLDSNIRLSLAFKESLSGSFTSMSITPSSNASYGNEDLEINNLLSDKIKMKDLFGDVVKQFNLIVQDNPNKKNDLIIEPSDDFYKSKQKVKDWTQLLDRDSDIKITPMSELDAKSYLYKYSNDTDLYNKEYLEETKKSYGELQVTIDNDFSTNTSKTELKFAPTPCSNYQIGERVAPFFVDKDGDNIKAKKVKQRILFYDGLKDITQDSLYLSEYINDPSATGLNSYPYCGMWDDPYNPTEDLGFGSTDKVYWNPTESPVSNLYEKFHRATLNNITNINSRLFEGSFKLTPKDIAEFDFRDVILIDGSYWRVNKIKDYDPIGNDKLTKVVLYKLIDLNIINKYNVLLPASNTSCPNDMIVKFGGDREYYSSVSGQPITPDCCNARGGDYVDGICYLPPNGTLNPSNEGGTVIVGNNTPTQEPNGTVSNTQDGNTNGSNNIPIVGRSNFVPEGAKSSMIIGDENSISKNIDNVLIVGDDIDADEPNTIYLEGVKINAKGIETNKTTIDTTDATPTDAITIPIPQSQCVTIDVICNALQTDNSQGLGNNLIGTYRNDAGTVKVIGAATTVYKHSDFSASGISFTISSEDVIVSVTGEAATDIRWQLTYKTTSASVEI